MKVLIPVPSYGFDPSETAIPFRILSENNIEITFATPDGKKAKADSVMLYGSNLGWLKKMLMAREDAVQAYTEMEKSISFCNPITYAQINPENYDGILFPGGHDKGVREYLESEILQKVAVYFFENKKPVAAVCHGLVLLARSINPDTNKSVLFEYKTTALLKSQELLAHNLTRLWLGDYYRTYAHTTVEDEVKQNLKSEKQFLKGNVLLARDTKDNLQSGFYVQDRNFISARWPGDIYSFSFAFLELLKSKT